METERFLLVFVWLGYHVSVCFAQASCQDNIGSLACNAFAIQGACQSRRAEMVLSCAKTCSMCSDQGALPCHDANSAICANYVVLNLCEQYKSTLHDKCKLSCGWCTRGRLSAWGKWSRCSTTCGVGSQYRTRTCNSRDCGIENTRQARRCNVQPCGPNRMALYTPWTPWSRCSQRCGEGTRTRFRRCKSQQYQLFCRVKELNQEKSCYIRSCPTRVYSWLPWSNWLECTRTCGRGETSRRRSCNYDDGASKCGTAYEETRFCNDRACPLVYSWLPWESWSGCSGSCTKEEEVRKRSCRYGSISNCGTDWVQRRACPQCQSVFSWSVWSSWNSCSRPCGGTRIRSRTCPGASSVTKCGSTHIESQTCNQFNCQQQPIVPEWLSWDPWGACDRPCNTGFRFRFRKCNTGQNADCGTQNSEGEVCNQQTCPPVQWNPWGSWGSCTHPCGGGTRSKTRICNTGRTQDCGALDEESEECNMHNCPDIAWLTWNPWSTCTRSCGDEGTHKRTRSCSTGRIKDCGKEFSQTWQCNTQRCPFSHRWNLWVQWTACTKPCGSGTQRRTRTCSTGRNADCGSVFRQIWKCNTQDCPVGRWNAWNSWTPCTKSCDSGSRTRTRSCSTGKISDCGTSSKQVLPCNPQACPAWNTWNAWTSCSTTCGAGERRRERTCNSGKREQCKVGSNIQKEECNVRACVVYSWANWRSWSQCSKSCGTGSKQRSRQCSSQNVLDCGQASLESLPCNVDDCPPVYNWMPWGNWLSCSVQCGGGERKRLRSCSSGNVVDCNGDPEQRLPCNQISCPAVWRPWSSWSSCTNPCGGGTTTRDRSCSSGNILDCGQSSKETVTCNTVPCQRALGWSHWNAWGACSRTCGSGDRVRSRRCQTDNCVGAEFDIGLCLEKVCTSELPWGPWTPCTKSCNVGYRLRQKICEPDSPPDCEVNLLTENATCATQSCFSELPWGLWSPCTKSCGIGLKFRERICEPDSPPDCGTNVPTQNTTCALKPCQSDWSDWNEWESCSVTCGRGTTRRSRSCTAPSCTGMTVQPAYCITSDCPQQDPTTCVCNCADDPAVDCGSLSKYCFLDLQYALKHCPVSCNMCEKCSCPTSAPVCPIGERPRYKSTGCCKSNLNVTCGQNIGRNSNIDDGIQTMWPWVVHVTTEATTCGGTLIASRWVLSAAHCYSSIRRSNVNVTLGGKPEETGINSRTYRATNVITHPNYQRRPTTGTNQYDVALLQLPEDAPTSVYISPVCLNSVPVIPSNMNCFIAGWGGTNRLQESQLRILDRADCQRAIPNLPQHNFCARSISSTCRMDSGGPLVCQMCQSCSWYVAGISSYAAAGCGTSTVPGVFTRAASFLVWINAITGNDQVGPRYDVCL